jgi:hypothetical protein
LLPLHLKEVKDAGVWVWLYGCVIQTSDDVSLVDDQRSCRATGMGKHDRSVAQKCLDDLQLWHGYDGVGQQVLRVQRCFSGPILCGVSL